jgi:phosphatidylinositol alpha 1,6-mannosyltransferase
VDRLRILIGAETHPPDVNGAARFTQRLAAGLARRGHDIHVVAPSATGRPSRDVQDGVTAHGLRSHRYPFHPDFRVCMPWEAFPDTERLLTGIRPDVVHTQGHLVVGRGMVRAAHRAGHPLVATNHLMPENLVAHVPGPRPVERVAARLAWRDLGRVFAKADIVTAPTPRAVELLEQGTGLVGAVPVSCGIDANAYRTDAGGTIPSVLFVGRLDQEKRVDELIRAFAALPARLPARLEIVGDGALRAEWTTLAARLGITERTTFHGFVSDDELVAAYARAAVFVMPGIAELQSIATLEAMAASTPVLAADAMALPHLVRPGRNGWLFTPGDVRGLTARLTALLDDPALRRRMGEHSRRLVADHAIDATLDTFETIYRRLTGTAGAIRDAA